MKQKENSGVWDIEGLKFAAVLAGLILMTVWQLSVLVH